MVITSILDHVIQRRRSFLLRSHIGRIFIFDCCSIFLGDRKIGTRECRNIRRKAFPREVKGKGVVDFIPLWGGGNEFGIKIWENKFLCGFLVIPNKEDVSSAITSISASEADEFSSPRGKGRGIRAEYRVKKINVGGNRC